MSDATLPERSAGSASAAGLLTDDGLARRATRGDRRAFAAIYRRYHQPLFRYCAAILGNPDDAHDALQNTMVKVLRSLPGERRHVRLKPWLYRIAHNESIELLRRRRPLEQLDPELLLEEADPAESAAARERLRGLVADLDELPERQRGALVMRELGGLSFEQIGEAFETSAAVARQTVYEARLGLQQMSEGREMRCEEVCRALSDGDRRVARRRDIRAHLRACDGCRTFRDGIDQRRRDLAAIAPLPPVAAAGLLHTLLGNAGGTSSGAGLGAGAGGAGSAGAAGSTGGLGAASAGGIGKAIAGSALLKGAATVAVVAAVGVSAADRSGVIHVLSGGGGPSHAAREATPSAAHRGPAATRATRSAITARAAASLHAGSAQAGAPAGAGKPGHGSREAAGRGGSAARGSGHAAAAAGHGRAHHPNHGRSGGGEPQGAATQHGQGASRSAEHSANSHAGGSAPSASQHSGRRSGSAPGSRRGSHPQPQSGGESNAKGGGPTGAPATAGANRPPRPEQAAPSSGSAGGGSHSGRSQQPAAEAEAGTPAGSPEGQAPLEAAE